ncbi:MAG: heavy metal-associated domain-containing protein [Porticoccus sp.]|nr:heavy metal-associated domain-containing protein [Porticoccus sp.]
MPADHMICHLIEDSRINDCIHQHQHQLQVEGATCGGCVKNIEQTLRSVAGVREARMDLARGIASVTGTVQSNDLIEALDRVGFHATVNN